MKKCSTTHELVDLQLESLSQSNSNVIICSKEINALTEKMGIPTIYYSDNGHGHTNTLLDEMVNSLWKSGLQHSN